MDERDRTILRVIQQGGNQSTAASHIGISRQAVSARLAKMHDALETLSTPELRLYPTLRGMRLAVENARNMLDQDDLDPALAITATELAKALARVETWAEELEWLIDREFLPGAVAA